MLDAHGRWFHDGVPVTHPGLAQSFARWIARHPDDGRAILSNGYDWCYLTVEATDCFVTKLSSRPDGAIELTLFDGSCEPLEPHSLRVDQDGLLQCKMADGRIARFGRQAQLAVAERLVDEDPPAIEIAGQRFVIEVAG